jgi:hypothetical protein
MKNPWIEIHKAVSECRKADLPNLTSDGLPITVMGTNTGGRIYYNDYGVILDTSLIGKEQVLQVLIAEEVFDVLDEKEKKK